MISTASDVDPLMHPIMTDQQRARQAVWFTGPQNCLSARLPLYLGQVSIGRWLLAWATFLRCACRRATTSATVKPPL